MKTRLLTFAAALALAPSAFAQTTLTATYKEGQVFKEKITADLVVGGSDATMTRSTKRTVTKIKEDGKVVIAVQDLGGKAVVGGAMEIEIPEVKPVMQTLDKQGKLVEIKQNDGEAGIMSPEVFHIMVINQGVTFADKAVKDGDSWTVEHDNPAVKGKKITVKFTLVGIEKVEGKDHLKLTQTSEAAFDADGGKVTTELTIFLDPKTNIAMKVTGKISDIPTQFGPMTMKFTVLTTTE